MLNLLSANIDVVIEDGFSAIFGFVAVIIGIIVAINKAKNKAVTADTDSDDDDDGYPFGNNPNAKGQLTPTQRAYIENTKRKAAQRNATPPVADTHHGDGHAHAGTAETYDPIVGSLGAVSDEGCDELNGVRLIVTDLTYQTDDDGKVYDMDTIRKSLILGEVLNNPRFKTPYGKK